MLNECLTFRNRLTRKHRSGCAFPVVKHSFITRRAKNKKGKAAAVYGVWA